MFPYYLLYVTFFYSHSVFSAVQNWSYNGKTADVTQWCTSFPTCCGKAQSPIDLKPPTDPNPLRAENALKFIDYDVAPKEISMSNNGNSVQLMINDSDLKPRISGGFLNQTYILHNVHFHWGKNSKKGAEHTFGGERFPIEMHIVHYSSVYQNLSQAVQADKPDALAVLGVVFRVGWFSNRALKPIVDMLSKVRFNEQKTLVSPFRLRDLLPPENGQFFRYFGSLTTPPCGQIVVWTVFGIPNYISEIQLDKFRALLATSEGEEPPIEISDNFRPVQPLNDQVVYISNEL